MLLIFSDSSRLITFFRKFDVCELETVFDFKTPDSPIKEEATRGIIQKNVFLKIFINSQENTCVTCFKLKIVSLMQRS